MVNDRECYYAYRERFNAMSSAGGADSPEAAGASTTWSHRLQRPCHFNRQGGFNVPFGRYRTIQY